VRLLRCRRFWYVHMDGSLSYHVSFTLKYEHTPADYYFISMLQKALAPKEFRVETAAPASGEQLRRAKPPQRTSIEVTATKTGLFPLDKLLVRGVDIQTGQWEPLAPFWHYVRLHFNEHARDLFKTFDIPMGDKAGKGWEDPFDTLVATDPFIEVPNLHVPRARFVFLFDDKTLFHDLLPGLDDNGNRVSRRHVVTDSNFDAFKEWIRSERRRCRAENLPSVVLPQSYLESVHPTKLRYLFISGFIQNIIDFMNQDASEILDSTDPIYPATPEQEEESFFVRYANQRSITQFVPGSRSLECGNDYIGSCPYVFLVHLLAMHNEFLVRDYERQTEQLTKDVENFNNKQRLSRAADRFYRFRTSEFTTYQKNKYPNVFRYDSERDLFFAVEERRGTHRKDEYLNAIVNNLEAQTRDLEGRLRSKVDRHLSLLLAAVSIFSVLQVLYQVLDISTRGMDHISRKPIDMLDFGALDQAQAAAKYLFLSTGGFLVITVLLTLWVVRQLVTRR